MAEKLFVNLWPGWMAGVAISALVVTMLIARNRLLSVSFCYAFLADRWVDWGRTWSRSDSASKTVHPEMPPLPGMSSSNTDPQPSSLGAGISLEPGWSTAFLLGILLGGIVSGVALRSVSGAPLDLSWAYPGFDSIWNFSGPAKTAFLFGGGILIGFGTRMSGGCTSGHAIVGVPAFQKASWIAMPAFFGVGIGVTFLLRGWLGI